VPALQEIRVGETDYKFMGTLLVGVRRAPVTAHIEGNSKASRVGSLQLCTPVGAGGIARNERVGATDDENEGHNRGRRFERTVALRQFKMCFMANATFDVEGCVARGGQ
jgi:hypothetical protein